VISQTPFVILAMVLCEYETSLPLWGKIKTEGDWESMEGKLHNDKMGSTCDTHGRNEKCIQNFSQQTWREETKETGCDDMD
jgi:hypothetical protein